MATASSITSAGTYLANGSFDEITYSPSNLTDSKNLFTNSQDFSAQGYWTPGGSSYSPVATNAVAPDGSYTASLFTGLGQYPNVTKYYTGFSGISAQPGEVYTFSVYLKYVNQPVACLVQENGWNGYYVIVNIQTGTLVSLGFNVTSYSITNVGNGWNRYSMTITVPSIQASWANGAQYYYNTTPPIPIAQFNPQIRLGNYDGTNYAGKQMLIWGAQLELSSTPTVYQPTGIPKNYLKFTQDFTKTNTTTAGGAWYIDNAVTTGNTIVAPDGTMTGSMITSTITGGNNTAFVNQTVVTSVNNTNYTYSVYLKQGTSPTSVVDFYNANPYNEITATVTWGATPSMVTGTASGGVVVASSFTNAGNGWYRVSLTINTLNNTAQLVCRVYVRGQGTNNIAGETVYIWGAQLEQSSSPGPYVSNGINITKINQLNQVFNNNSLLYSQLFSDATWLKARASIATTTATTDPNGTSTALKLVSDTTPTATHYCYQPQSVLNGVTYTFSIFAKAAEFNNAYIQFYTTNGAFTTTSAYFDLVNGVVGSTSGNVYSATINYLSNGWYRISLSSTAIATATGNVTFQLANNGSTVLNGDGVSGVYFWGAQFEFNKALPTAYQNNLGTITPVLSYTQPTTKTVADGTVYVSGNYDEVTYNPSSVNLLSYSQELDNSAWSKNAVTILPNTIIAPDGTLTADKIQETAVTNFFAVVQNPTALPSKSYTMSFYAKAGERTQVVVSFTVSNAYVMYNLATGTVTTTSGAYLVGSSITFVGNGWYRCTASLTSAPSGSNLLYFIIALANSSSDTYAGTAGYGAYVWGTQLEQNTVPTTYQVTPPVSPPPNLYNLLTYSQDLSNVVWDKSASGTGTIPVVTPNFALAPDGTLTASKVDYASGGNGQSTVGNGGISNPTVGTTRTFSVWMRTLTGTTGVTLYNGDEVTSVSVTTDWQRFSYTRTTVGTNAYGVRLSKREIWGTGGTASVLIWGAQWEVGSTTSIYQGVSAQNTLITGFAKRDTQAGITYVTDKFDEFTKILPVTSGLILNLDSTKYNGGTTWQNQTVNSYNATLINNPAYNSDNGGIIKFTGNSSTPQYATTNIPSSTFTPSSNWTMSTWVRFNATNNSLAYLNPRPDGLGFFGTSGNLLGCVWFGNYGLFWTTNVFNNVRGFYAGSQVRTGPVYAESNIQTSNLAFGVWYNVTGVYDYTGNSHKLYLNGALVNTGPVITTGTFQNLATIPFIVSGTDGIYGGSGGGKVLDGDLGQNLIYNRALTAQEVLDNYNALKGRYGY